MTEHKFTDEEVIKALECCNRNGSCSKCPYDRARFEYETDCASEMTADALDLIKRQRAEIERLDTIVNPKEHGVSFYMMINETEEKVEAYKRQLKAEAVNDFVEKCRSALKKEIEISNDEDALYTL